MIRQLPCAFSLIVDDAGKSKGTCQQEGAPQWKIAAVSGAGANVKIDGKSIGAVKSYTFENVSRTHTIEVIFMKANGNPQTGVFVDVATGSYYEDAVDCAVLFSLQETNQ